MKLLSFAGAAGLVLLAGCTSGPTRQARLECPTRQGELTRTSVSPDGRTCAYAGKAGDELTLQLLPVSGSPEATLARIEQAFPAAPTVAASIAAGGVDDTEDPAASNAAAGEHTEVSLPGVYVSANDAGASVRIGGLHVDANEGAAVVRESRDVRLKGEAFALTKRGYRGKYVVAGEDLPSGYAAYGYVAAGPRRGPLTVAVFKMKDPDRQRVLGDLDRLVRRNGGV